MAAIFVLYYVVTGMKNDSPVLFLLVYCYQGVLSLSQIIKNLGNLKKTGLKISKLENLELNFKLVNNK